MSAKSDLLFVDGSQGASGDMLLGALVEISAAAHPPADGAGKRASVPDQI